MAPELGGQSNAWHRYPGTVTLRADYYEAKGRLYYAIKRINRAGRALHADCVPEAAKFNMSILYRRPTAQAPEPQTQPAP